jgi:excinuclease ABC subunit C
VRKLSAATVQEIAAVPGFGLRTAEAVHEALHRDGESAGHSASGGNGSSASNGSSAGNERSAGNGRSVGNGDGAGYPEGARSHGDSVNGTA